ncbi:hypothetical protein Vadar_018317 [Vaccinium darrowii]|uniref:Uncharacterized protein n=1 Tax=Vaccinium darrowii TaxID=229202 RepID=A0ACB7XAM6_9ERIC|nr:hypothetical protein Vadar_018317 [Vaccinium darrowii]
MFYRPRVSITTTITREVNGSQIPKQFPKPAPPARLTLLPERWYSSSSSLLSIPPSKSTQHRDGHFIRCCSPPYDCDAAPTPIDDRNLFHGNLYYYYYYSRQKLAAPHNLSQLRRLHALLIVGGGFFHSTDTALGSHLVHTYVKFGSVHEALLVFHHHLLPQKNKNNHNHKIIAWNAILRGYVNAGQFSEAIELYNLMLTQRNPLVPDNFTYPLVLKACSGISALQTGRGIVESIRFNTTHSNKKPNIYVECAAVDMFAKCGSLGEARMVFEDMTSRDLASWTAIICGTMHIGNWLEALHLFTRMRSEQGIKPDSAIVAVLLRVCGRLEEARQLGMTLQGFAIRSGFETDLYISNALVDMYCKCGDTLEAYRIFSNMVHKDAVSWNTLIAGYVQNCDYPRSIELYLEMKSFGVRTTAVTAASVLPGFGRLKLLKQGKELHSYILKQGFLSDIVLASALIDMYANCGAKREAEHIFGIMSDKDIVVWNSMIVGCACDEDFDSAFRIFRGVWHSGLKPNSITLISILPVCAKWGTVKQGKEVHGYAIRSSLGTVVSVVNCLLDMYCKCGYLDLGAKVFDKMSEKNVVTYNTVISAHGIHGQAQQAFSFFDMMKAANIRPNKLTL